MFKSFPVSKHSHDNSVTPFLNPTSIDQPINEAIKQVFKQTALSSGSDFFKSLARNLSYTLGIPYVVLNRLGDDGKLHPLAFWNEDQLSELKCYNPDIAPCGITLKDGYYFCPENVQQVFPEDGDLVNLKSHGFLGVALKNSQEEVLGNLYIVDRRPIADPKLYQDVLKLFAMRATAELEREQYLQRIHSLSESNSYLYKQEQIKSAHLSKALYKLEQTQVQLVHTEKIAALGQLVAGIAHEVNNPMSCIFGNLKCSKNYLQDLFEILALYQAQLPNPDSTLQDKIEEVDLDFVLEDLPNILASMEASIFRVKDIMQSLRNYSRNDTHECKKVDIHKGLDITLMILRHKLKANSERPEIQVNKNYGNLPEIFCFPGPLNQVFMNLLANTIDAFDEMNRGKSYQEIEVRPNIIEIETTVLTMKKSIQITIADNGPGMPKEVREKIFNAFFTTKPEGRGTGLGLSITWDIVTKMHKGKIECLSEIGQGTRFIMEIPQGFNFNKI